MASISFDDAIAFSNNNSNSNSVSFFKLNGDGDSAIVRFLYEDISQFDILTVHKVTSNGRSNVNVGCIRTQKDPLGKCPLCASGAKVNARFFIKMLQYDKDDAGNVTIHPVVWERSIQYAQKLKNFIDNYGDISDMVCKIIRKGAAGDIHTDYDIMPALNPSIYRDDIYIKDTSAFDNYSILGTIVQDRTNSEMEEYIENGDFTPKDKTRDNPVPDAPMESPFTPSNNGQFVKPNIRRTY